jgi:hypothetical protein
MLLLFRTAALPEARLIQSAFMIAMLISGPINGSQMHLPAKLDGPMQPKPIATVDHMDVRLTRLPGPSELPGREAAASFACRRSYTYY